MTKVNIREALNQIDKDTNCKYDLVTLYEGYNFNDEEKKEIAKMISDNEDAEVIYDRLSDKFRKDVDFDDDDISDIMLDECDTTTDYEEYFDFDDLDEDTIKTSKGKWVNKGEEGTHGTFDTKKEADAQRKAMFASGWKGEALDEELKTYYISYKESEGKFKDKYVDLPVKANSKEEAEEKFLKDHPNIKSYDYKVLSNKPMKESEEESLKESVDNETKEMLRQAARDIGRSYLVTDDIQFETVRGITQVYIRIDNDDFVPYDDILSRAEKILGDIADNIHWEGDFLVGDITDYLKDEENESLKESVTFSDYMLDNNSILHSTSELLKDYKTTTPTKFVCPKDEHSLVELNVEDGQHILQCTHCQSQYAYEDDDPETIVDLENTDESLKEASYGGAYDIADDEYFTKDDGMEAANEVAYQLEKEFPESKLEVMDMQLDNHSFYVTLTDKDGNEFSEEITLDMRKIRHPLDLIKKYAPALTERFIKQINDYYSEM